jgi:hypothetical protein
LKPALVNSSRDPISKITRPKTKQKKERKEQPDQEKKGRGKGDKNNQSKMN